MEKGSFIMVIIGVCILYGAFASFKKAVLTKKEEGTWDNDSIGSLGKGMFFFCVAAAFIVFGIANA